MAYELASFLEIRSKRYEIYPIQWTTANPQKIGTTINPFPNEETPPNTFGTPVGVRLYEGNEYAVREDFSDNNGRFVGRSPVALAGVFPAASVPSEYASNEILPIVVIPMAPPPVNPPDPDPDPDPDPTISTMKIITSGADLQHMYSFTNGNLADGEAPMLVILVNGTKIHNLPFNAYDVTTKRGRTFPNGTTLYINRRPFNSSVWQNRGSFLVAPNTVVYLNV